jgi:predicted DNA-binding protein
MVKTVHLSPEIKSRLFVISWQVGLGEDELITEAIMNYLEDFEDIQEAQVRLSTPRLISGRGICIHYDVAEFQEDVRHLQEEDWLYQ